MRFWLQNAPFKVKKIKGRADAAKNADAMESPGQNPSLQRLQNVEKRVVRVLELAGGVMDELASPNGTREEAVLRQCSELMQLIKDIQVTLRDEIKSACEYRPFEKCDYSARISNEICCKKIEYVLSQLDGMQRTIEQYQSSAYICSFIPFATEDSSDAEAWYGHIAHGPGQWLVQRGCPRPDQFHHPLILSSTYKKGQIVRIESLFD